MIRAVMSEVDVVKGLKNVLERIGVASSKRSEVRAKCPDVRWHLIGHLQRNKVNKVVGVPGIHLVESVDSRTLASALDAAWGRRAAGQLRVMVQVNTSGEAEKSGCKREEVTEVVKHVVENCTNLQFVGLMTIGKYGYDPSQGPNPDYVSLLEVRKDVCLSLGVDPSQLELSMGMSDDFEQAVEMGSTNVRIGSAIFGHREKKQKSITEES
ncbi:pyridoxal phosphate homeostasis protein isoform X2 [Bacillus rossius redtenbacheri]|uniref:pyridoxal phosphate homeostasis protein isoform X2 n=1 Tax=Bacillus rossius redtenbacheri TaxID=93214 RepID=UPI002FDE0FBA